MSHVEGSTPLSPHAWRCRSARLQSNAHCGHHLHVLQFVFSLICDHSCWLPPEDETRAGLVLQAQRQASWLEKGIRMNVVHWIGEQIGAAIPEFLGGLAVAIILGLGAYLRRQARRQPPAPTRAQHAVSSPSGDAASEALVALVPRHRSKFRLEPAGARTDDDEAGLALISEIIRQRAQKCIEVIGRGPHLVDAKTEEYITSVTKAILRGVDYSRILIIDDALPENGLVWLLLLERFIALPKYSGAVALYPIRMARGENLHMQFQLVDRTILHRTHRQYIGQPAASRRAQSLFAITPHPEVDTHITLFQQYLAAQNRPSTHAELILLVEKLLATIRPSDSKIAFHWRVALEVIQFLDRLSVAALPPRGFELVGSLMPFTFSYEAARRFSSRRRLRDATKPAVVIPFERFDDAVQALLRGAIDYLCLPTENTRIDHLTPPTLTSDTLLTLKQLAVIDTIDVQVSFVLAGKAQTVAEGNRLAAVDAAWRQVKDRLTKRVQALPSEESVESNYHAAWLASRNPDLIAITSPAAATFFGLHDYKRFESGVTSFSVFSKHVPS
jgi:hypothetical protein